jgi:hypothetical protein
MESVPTGTRIGAGKSRLTEEQIQKILRRVREDQAFHFYRGFDQPMNEAAVSLTDLFKKIERVDVESVAFHQARGDFEKWVRAVLGDGELAMRLGRISHSSCGEELRVEILREIKARMNQFRVNNSQ